MKLKSVSVLSILGLGLLSQSILAGNITAINVVSLPNQQRLIKIQFDKDLVLPRGFTTENPSRIALDFPKTGLSIPHNLLKFDDQLLKQIQAGQATDRTRLLFTLNQAGQYNATLKGNEVWIYLQQSLPTRAKNKSTPSSAPVVVAMPKIASTYAPANTITKEVENISSVNNTKLSTDATATVSIDFQKGKNNNGIVSITGLNQANEPTIKRKPSSLTLTYKNFPLPTEQQRNLDVQDFSTPVKSIRLRRIGKDTELNLQMMGNWDYTQRKRGSNLVLEVNKSLEIESAGLQRNKSFKGKKISLDFQDVDVRTILQILAKESGTNIVASDSVQGKITISLNNVPWDQALDVVMQARNLDMRREGNVIKIAPRDELLKIDVDLVTQQNKIDTLGPLLSQTFQLKYRSVEEFRKLLNVGEDGKIPEGNTIFSPRGSALTDSGTNTLIITDTEKVIKKFEKLIAQTDIPLQQVLIEARIVETTDGYARELGTKFGYAKYGKNTWNGKVPTDGSTPINKPVDGNDFTIRPNVNLGVTNPTSIVSLVHQFASGALMLELSASQTEGKSKIISSPRVLTQDRKEAKIESGYEVPYQESAASGGTSTSFKDAVLGLTVTPQITPDGNVIMTLNVQNDRPIACTNVDASIRNNGDICMQKRNVETQAMIENGGTLIIGGIYNENNENSISKVPLLGDIPVVGNLFKYRKNTQQRNELLVFITPRIVDSSTAPLQY